MTYLSFWFENQSSIHLFSGSIYRSLFQMESGIENESNVLETNYWKMLTCLNLKRVTKVFFKSRNVSNLQRVSQKPEGSFAALLELKSSLQNSWFTKYWQSFASAYQKHSQNEAVLSAATEICSWSVVPRLFICYFSKLGLSWKSMKF